MSETLLSQSNILLFGREVGDLKVVVPPPVGVITVGLASTDPIPVPGPFPRRLDGYPTSKIEQILLKDQTPQSKNGIYRRGKGGTLDQIDLFPSIRYVRVLNGTANEPGTIYLLNSDNGEVVIYTGGDETHSPFVVERGGLLSQIQAQIHSARKPTFARVYSFSYEGYYYDLPRSTLFLVHGKGIPASEARAGLYGKPRQARAPGDPSLTGLGAADFQFSDDIMVWSYDQADYTIRMDVETGMFEDVLLAAMLGGGPGGMDAAGMNARGMNARGMNARGMNARGMNARGMNARGGGNSD